MSKLSNIKLLKIVGEVKKENPISKYCFLLENFPIKWSPFTEHWKWYFRSSLRKGYIVLFTWTSHKDENGLILTYKFLYFLHESVSTFVWQHCLSDISWEGFVLHFAEMGSIIHHSQHSLLPNCRPLLRIWSVSSALSGCRIRSFNVPATKECTTTTDDGE